KPRARFIRRRFGLIELRIGRPALLAQFPGARFCSARLRKHPGRSAQFGSGLLGLQRQIDLIERRQRLARLDPRSDLAQTVGDLAGDPEAEIAFDPRADGSYKAPLADLWLVTGRGDQDRTDRD